MKLLPINEISDPSNQRNLDSYGELKAIVLLDSWGKKQGLLGPGKIVCLFGEVINNIVK